LLNYKYDGARVLSSVLASEFYDNPTELKLTRNPIPEPATLALIGLGVLSLLAAVRQRAKRRK
jgi:hypothetical protein